MTAEFDRQLDTRGLNCPLPILKTKRELVRMEPGQRLYVIATDPASVQDFSAFAEHTGHRLLKSETRDDEFHFLLERT
ncbi:MAG: sulfurtransferase TusA family protein [Gammaproteobacteria bacterium]|nr:sulfurtransferase TusA family protein [Gammaproteobacteria bacterium]